MDKPRNDLEERNDDPDEETIELSLGLSLNGKFGLDPNAKRLKRSCSIPEFMDPSRLGVVEMSGEALVRTCSLPTGAEEEARKRKEVQMLRRMEAKKKRNLRLAREESCEVLNGGGHHGNSRFGKPPLAPPPSPQGSVGSQGTGLSDVTDSENHLSRGVNKPAEARSPASIQGFTESELKAVGCVKFFDNLCMFVESAMDITCLTSKCAKSRKELIKNVLGTLPYLSTKEVGANGKRINGFLYRYQKDDDLMIMCVCHGSFMTPAEFVKHGGGIDVANPLGHIVVNPSPFL